MFVCLHTRPKLGHPYNTHANKTGCWELPAIRSSYHLPVVQQGRNSTVPPAAWILLHFQSLKEELINSIIPSAIFMA